jgi:putative transcriptional regulator
MPRFHVQEALLLDYASGTLPSPVSLLVATHLTLCPVCRGAVGNIEMIGGALLDGIDPIAMTADALDVALDAVEAAPVETVESAGSMGHDSRDPGVAPIPLALSAVLDGPTDGLAWKRRARGIAEVELACADDGYFASLLRIDPGVAIPTHTHEGEEITLVLRGKFTDEAGQYGRGDVCHADAGITHAPVADPDGSCLCLVVADGSVKLTGLVGRILNPFLGL